MLEVRDLRVRYAGGSRALDGVSLIAHPGEVVAVVGPNGSGKSTLLRVVAGLVPAHEGIMRFNRETLSDVPAHRRAARGIAYVPERAPILSRLTVRDNLAVGSWHRRDRREVAEDLERILDLFPELRAQLRDPANLLSAADRQMLAIARGILSRPRLLLLDEPLICLDPGGRGRILSTLRTLRAEGAAILVAEHDLGMAAEMAERAYGLLAGRMAFAGSTAALGQTSTFGALY